MSKFTTTEHTVAVHCKANNHRHAFSQTGLCECGAPVIQTHTGKLIDRHRMDGNGNVMCFVAAHVCQTTESTQEAEIEVAHDLLQNALKVMSQTHIELMDACIGEFELSAKTEITYHRAVAKAHEAFADQIARIINA
jgi:hypothetical protein